MFEHLVNEAASRLSLPVANVSVLMRELLALLTNERTGGIIGFADRFHRTGLGDVFTSWYGGHESRPITSSHLETALGTETLDRMAASSGLTRSATTSALALMLPRLITYLTPNGVLPTNRAIQSSLSEYAEPAPAAPYRSGERSGVSRWLPLAVAALLVLAGLLWVVRPERTIMPQASLHDREGNVIFDNSTPSAVGTSGVLTDAPPAIDLTVITFGTGSSRIPAESMSAIRSSAQALKGMPAGWKVEIGGHTDNKGNSKSNVALSQARADAVRNALVESGAPASMLTTKGYGDTQPRATNDTEDGRSQNRRIEYTVER
jgi:outer membrane protein OmpA-like peptidoglycan-associated protein/uncharacterized protein YidB (DUF937 family)